MQVPRASITPGSGAGQLDGPRDVAADPGSGHLFVSELFNDRTSEFTAWGAFVKAWGWDVSPEGAPGDTPSDQFEICTTSCKQASSGSGVGQFLNPNGVTVDGAGNVYVYDRNNFRVQKFSPTGEFLLMFGDGVNQGPTNPGDVCTAAHVAAGDICGPGTGGEGTAQLEDTPGNYIAYGAVTNSIFVGDTDMIQEFNLDGTFKKAIRFEGALEAFDGTSVTALDTDLAGNLYITLEDRNTFTAVNDVHKLSPAGALLLTFPVKSPLAVAVDRIAIGPNVYAIESQARVLGFQASGAPIEGMEPGDGFGSEGVSLFGLGTNLCAGSEAPGNLYVSYFNFGSAAFVNAYGTPPFGCEAPPLGPPEVVEEYATSVDSEGAVVKAEIDPNLLNDTTFFVQYGTAECRDSGWTSGCERTEAAKLSENTTDFPTTTEGVFLGKLDPGTTYFYRFVAQSGGGAAVGAGNIFRTFAAQTAPTPDCAANAHLRIDTATFLPDCRAYEMVSPLDKNNGDIRVPINENLFPVSLFQAAAAGDAFTYSSSVAFGEGEGAPLTSQYFARRDPTQGWVSGAISPQRTRQVGNNVLDPEFKDFSADLCQAWLRHDSDPPLTADAVPGYLNLYRIDYCAGGRYEALTTEEPPHVACVPGLPAKCPFQYFPLELQGTSADGAKAVYVASDNLADAPVNDDNRAQLYYLASGETHFVCVLPGGAASTEGCSAGTYGNDDGTGRLSSLQNAISADGSVVYWSEGPLLDPFQPGKIISRRLFVRVHPEQGAIGAEECSAPEKACTYPVSDAVSPGARSHFWAATDDGSKAIFTIEDGPFAGNLYQFEIAKAKAGETANTLIAEGVKGVLGVSEDANRIYFASSKDLDGGGEAQGGDLNLYFYDTETGSHSFIGALAATDLISGRSSAPIQKAPFYRSSRVTPDGSHAAFTSSAPLTGYDNRDARSGERDREVFLYDAEADELICASCNPSGARPSGRQVDLDKSFSPWIAGRIPGWERALYASRLLTEDGQRLFFESFDALVPRDTNGEQDVYQWEALGKGDCDSGDSGFAPANGGCVELISSGESARESSFFDTSLSGDDVFFTTLSSLVPQDYGLVDLYDARVGGGFPPPPAAKEPCEGEACQSPPARPEWPTPASTTYQGPGDVKPVRKRRCGKGKRRVVRKGKARCVRKKGAKQRKRANDNRRAGR